jgi:hypothetical protein
MTALDDLDDEDEDWTDDDNEPDESDPAPCPECGKPVEYVAESCPACGYWILKADRQDMWAEAQSGKPTWIRVAAAVVLVAMVCAALLAFF